VGSNHPAREDAVVIRSAGKNGAALLLALWALFLLSAMIISWALDINTRLTLNGHASRTLEAEAMASSGAEIALDPMTKPTSSLLRQTRGNQSFEARISGEGGRLNLNWIVAGENPARLELLRHYLENRGIELNDRDRMIDCLLDWVDPDNLVRLNGAEADGDYRPANALLRHIDDVKEIRGWEKFTSDPNWDADFTITSTGPIDLAWASRDVLLSLPGLTEPIVDQFLQLRTGPDGVEGTEDDAPFNSLDDIRNALSLSPDQFKALAPVIGFKDQVLRVVSVGRSSDVTHVVRMVFRKTGNVPQLISWKEF
jgi:type II secretory pathway component PulK